MSGIAAENALTLTLTPRTLHKPYPPHTLTLTPPTLPYPNPKPTLTLP